MSTILITGTSRGIGRVIALYLARQGYRIFASMRNPDIDAAPLRDAARAEGLKLEVIQLDVDDPSSSQRAVKEVIQQAGQIDVLINNAGIGGYEGAIEETPDSVTRAIFETNFFGAMQLTRLVLPDMRSRKSGAIVNNSSVGGRIALAGMGAFAASKFALEAMSEVLAQELQRFNIRVAIIEPGIIDVANPEEEDWEPDLDSPYMEFTRRCMRIYAEGLKNPTPPERVAETIQHALETDRPKLRYLVGEDATMWISARQRMTDEEWVDLGKEMTDEEFATFHRNHVGREI